MLSDLSLISHGAAAIAFGLLTILVATRYLRRDVDRALFVAALATTLWASTLVSQSLWGTPGFIPRYIIELLRDGAWITLLLSLIHI